jgi:hypothetical protein
MKDLRVSLNYDEKSFAELVGEVKQLVADATGLDLEDISLNGNVLGLMLFGVDKYKLADNPFSVDFILAVGNLDKKYYPAVLFLQHQMVSSIINAHNEMILFLEVGAPKVENFWDKKDSQ